MYSATTQLVKPKVRNGAKTAGWILTSLSGAFLLLDGLMKLAKPVQVTQAMAMLGYPQNAAAGIGITLIVCTLLYLIPRTSILGAVLLTGYLGGAVASQVRVGNPPFELAFPVIFGVLVWIGLYLREPKLKQII